MIDKFCRKMKFNYPQEMFIRMAITGFIIMIAILFLTSCSNDDKLKKCEELANTEYNLYNTFCRDCLITNSDCCCNGYNCKNKSCERRHIEFYLKENLIRRDKNG